MKMRYEISRKYGANMSEMWNFSKSGFSYNYLEILVDIVNVAF